MMNGVLRLYDVEDVEAFLASGLERYLQRKGAFLDPSDREDALSFLLMKTWEEAARFDPDRVDPGYTKSQSFSTFLHRRLDNRIVDWYRQRYGDSRHGKKPDVLSLDAHLVCMGNSESDTGTLMNEVADEDDWIAEVLDRVAALDIHGVDLSERARWILEEIAVPISQGMTHDDLAKKHNRGPRWIHESLTKLREELLDA